MSGDLHGQCLCGAVQVTVRNAPHDLGACHCAMCRRWTGSAFITLDVPEADMTVTGADHVRSYTSPTGPNGRSAAPAAARCGTG